LTRTAADLTTTDHRRPSVSLAIAQTLGISVGLACMRCLTKKKARASLDLNQMVAYRFEQAAGFGPAWLRSAASARSVFFLKFILLFL
jgi:hypothetical protein